MARRRLRHETATSYFRRTRASFVKTPLHPCHGSPPGIGHLAPTQVTRGQELSTQEPPAGKNLGPGHIPEWFQDAKLGIFIHWGVYSVPAYSGVEDYGEWFLRGLQEGDTLRTEFMREHYGEDFTYTDFAPLFEAELFDADEWAELFRRAGAKYVVLVSKHHDGYALWPSEYSPGWNSMDVGPGRNLVGELTFAVRKAGLRMGLYYSLAEWNNPLHRWYTDPRIPSAPYVEQYMIPQFKELVSAYKPDGSLHRRGMAQHRGTVARPGTHRLVLPRPWAPTPS